MILTLLSILYVFRTITLHFIPLQNFDKSIQIFVLRKIILMAQKTRKDLL